MAIDDPLDAGQERVDAEERESSPIRRFIPDLADLTDVLPIHILPFGEFGKSVLKGLGMWVNREEAGRRKYLIECLTAELRRIRARLETLDESHRVFTEEEFLPLVLDGLQKAEQTRSKARIGRIAAILAHSLEVDAIPSADNVEEMMRVATILSDDDVVILRSLFEGQISAFNRSIGKTDFETANEFWARLNGPNNDPIIGHLMQFSTGQLLAVCSKLQSLGLLVQVERNQMKLPPGATPYALLEKGVRFVEYIRGHQRVTAA